MILSKFNNAPLILTALLSAVLEPRPRSLRVRKKGGGGYTIHSFRHSMRDKLRTVECPSDVFDQIRSCLRHNTACAF